MFYGALNPETVLSEILPEVGDRVFLGVAKIRDGRQCAATVFGEIDQWRRYGATALGGLEPPMEFMSGINELPDDERLRLYLIDAFFADVFSQPASTPRDYKTTSILANAILRKPSSPFQALFYPSVAHRGGFNMAIVPEAFDQSFEWVEFLELEIINYLGYGIYEFNIEAQATSTNESGLIDEHGLIAWGEPKPEA
jgi:hypothetical protein